jgi:short-subunit dehydrogenase
MLRERRGHIVNVASVMGLMAVSQMTDYNASKAATVSMHASLRNELDYRYVQLVVHRPFLEG